MEVGTWSRVLRACVSGAINILFDASTLPSLIGAGNVGISLPSKCGIERHSNVSVLDVQPTTWMGLRYLLQF
jgi:hypothetical protein